MQRNIVMMFVDDEQPILASLRRVLRKVECEKLFLQSPIEALEVLAQREVHVVISDMRMPGMNGADFLAQVANKYPDTVRVAFSGFSDEAIVEKVFQEGGIWGYLTKPWDNDEIVKTMNYIIENVLVEGEDEE